MKYYYEKPSVYVVTAARTYHCDHPLYSECTLYLKDDLGLAVIQERFSPGRKVFWWGAIDPWLVDDIFSRDGFQEYFSEHCGSCTDGLYPTVTVRQIMWALRMKPLKKLWWESR